MKYLHQIQNSPAGNLAMDEAILNWCEDGNAPGGILRFWESSVHFVVLGFSNKATTETNQSACKADGIPVLRRISGGGTVLQGPGCLNYQLVLPIDSRPQLQSVTTTNKFIMETLAGSLANTFNTPIEVCGYTDLVWNSRKFSGNAQRRKRHFLAFHGTILHQFDLNLITRYLAFPSLVPDYRGTRDHLEFVGNLSGKPDRIIRAISDTWQAHEPISNSDLVEIQHLATDLETSKYSSPDWNDRV